MPFDLGVTDNVVMIKFVQKTSKVTNKLYHFKASPTDIKQLQQLVGRKIVVSGHYQKPQRALLVGTKHIARTKLNDLTVLTWYQNIKPW